MDVVLQVSRWLGLVAPQAPVPLGPPIERIAADLRRIRADLRQAPSGMPVARLRGWWAAYDDVLVTACRALGLEQCLESLLTPAARELERARVERTLVRAGLLADLR
ncbi:MAG: hypothetical protein WCS84_07835 [Nocardioides sp.]